jgi:hypothetical protein
MSETETGTLPSFDDAEAAWGAMKLLPARTGLPMPVWITANEGWPHDVRVRVARTHGARGRRSDAASVAVRPQPREIVPSSLSAGDFALARRWIELNRQLIIDVWEGRVDAISEDVYPLLQRLP